LNQPFESAVTGGHAPPCCCASAAVNYNPASSN
jgi:hypothetical protein